MTPRPQARLAEPWMTTHSVFAVGRPLLAKGAKELCAGERIEARLRVAGTDDVSSMLNVDHSTAGPAPRVRPTLDTDAAAECCRLGPQTS